MIIKFKIFEAFNEGKPKVGDYVLGESVRDPESKSVLNVFLKENIGKIIDIRKSTPQGLFWKYFITYEKHIPTVKFREDIGSIPCMALHEKYIKYWSDDKKELELLLTANKYNL